VLHPWNQKIDAASPCPLCRSGGLSLDHTHWIRSEQNYFLPKAKR
jgi:hypothetical protein